MTDWLDWLCLAGAFCATFAAGMQLAERRFIHTLFWLAIAGFNLSQALT